MKLLTAVPQLPLLTFTLVKTAYAVVDIPFGVSGSFSPIACGASMGACENWSSKNFNLNGPIEIGCSECVTMDITDESTITLASGLDIQGKLLIPSTAKVTIKTPVLLVQGELVIDAPDQVISPTNQNVKIVMTGTDDLTFTPNAQNHGTCIGGNDADACVIGKKAIVVAGGKVSIDGWPNDSCPTWVKLKENDLSSNPVPGTVPKQSIVDGCSETFFSNDFSSGLSGGWRASAGGLAVVTDSSEVGGVATPDGIDGNYIQVKRSKDWQGLYFDIKKAMSSCLLADTPYLFRARARFVSTTGVPSRCSTKGTDLPNNCLKLKLGLMTVDSDTLKYKTLHEDPPSAGVTDGQWFHFQSTVTFTEEDLSNNMIFRTLFLTGPEAGIDMSFDDIVLEVPPTDFYPATAEDTCAELIYNGQADSRLSSTYPFSPSPIDGTFLSTNTDSSNPHFKITGRNHEWATMHYTLNSDCIKKNTLYKFQSKVRIHGTEPLEARMVLKKFIDTAGDTAALPFELQTIVNCPVSKNNWVLCESVFEVTEDHEGYSHIELMWAVDEFTDDAGIVKHFDVDIDDVSVTFEAGMAGSIRVDASVQQCWGVGSEIMITSHSLDVHATDVDTISAISIDGTDAVITLTNGIPIHTTTGDNADGEDFASEVALLTRNILFTAEADPVNVAHGGHFQILHTPSVTSNIEGVEIKGFGQAGNIGRYPINYHMSEDVTGSSIARNTIRDSYQRGIVLKNTNGCTITKNIAYNNFGHTYMLEDGSETDNVFTENVGAVTKAPDAAWLLNVHSSDLFPATFYSASPPNTWESNVAAGSDNAGFWFELLEHVAGPSEALHPDTNPSHLAIGSFSNNVIHSNNAHGLTFYPNGYYPDTTVTISNTRAYRNVEDGVLLQNVHKISVDSGLFADNRIQVEIEKGSEDISVKNAKLIGLSNTFKAQVNSNVMSHCPAYRGILGLQFHSFTKDRGSKGFALENLSFANFDSDASGCEGSMAVAIDDETRGGHFDAYTSLKSITYPTDAPKAVNLCNLDTNGVKDVMIEDLTGDSDPTGSNTPGFIVSNDAQVVALLTGCTEIVGACAQYCPNVCLRTINFAVDPSISNRDDLAMEVSDGTNKATFHSYFDEKVDTEGNPDSYENSLYQRRVFVTAIIPGNSASYTLRFFKNGDVTWPTFVERQWDHPPQCAGFATESDITIVEPSPNALECKNLIRNGNGMSGGSTNMPHNPWVHTGGGVQSYAPGAGGSGLAISSFQRTDVYQGPGQFLDTRCLTEGAEYEIIAKVKTLDRYGNPAYCDPAQPSLTEDDMCPRGSFQMKKIHSDGTINATYAYPMALTIGDIAGEDGWKSMYGFFKVSPTIAEAESVLFFVEGLAAESNIIIDDVSIVETERSCQYPIYNYNFEKGDTRNWYVHGYAGMTMADGADGSDFSVKTTYRDSYWSSPAQDINTNCVTLGERSEVSARIKLEKDGEPYDCDPNLIWGQQLTGVCPKMTIRAYNGDTEEDEDVASITGTWGKEGWNTMHGSFSWTQAMMDSSRLMLFFQKFERGVTLYVDNVLVVPSVPWDCSQLFRHNDAEKNDTRYWDSYAAATVTNEVGGYNSDRAFMASNRFSEMAGVGQIVDSTCITLNNTYSLSAKIKLEKVITINGTTTTEDFDCDPYATFGATRCPVATIAASDYIGGGTPQHHTVATMDETMTKGEWNTISGIFNFFENEFFADHTMFVFHKAPPNVNILVDDVVVTVF
eukprot:CAMPEP_0195530994 /NCGR_PEP_ID=MMETSP0794_2-20130614/34107_1 /TAXON_ID=515487 /ORGANISM="Stephanopyxis turris, Strain CCMP 815" /LENGTH=1734 /DNA_ID=CAMNT_0040662623 /DNA_START=145 /DNA_END=5349 /DNA_ORIENTATION=-